MSRSHVSREDKEMFLGLMQRDKRKDLENFLKHHTEPNNQKFIDEQFRRSYGDRYDYKSEYMSHLFRMSGPNIDLLLNYTNPSMRDENGNNLLHYAVLSDNTNNIQRLIDWDNTFSGKSILKNRNKNGEDAIMYGLDENKLKAAVYLLPVFISDTEYTDELLKRYEDIPIYRKIIYKYAVFYEENILGYTEDPVEIFNKYKDIEDVSPMVDEYYYNIEHNNMKANIRSSSVEDASPTRSSRKGSSNRKSPRRRY